LASRLIALASTPIAAEASGGDAVKRLVSPQVQLSLENRLRKYSHLLGSNPRAMKRVVNTHTVQQQLLVLTGAEINADTLPLWTILTITLAAPGRMLVRESGGGAVFPR
jgi:hypothetical protein